LDRGIIAKNNVSNTIGASQVTKRVLKIKVNIGKLVIFRAGYHKALVLRLYSNHWNLLPSKNLQRESIGHVKLPGIFM